MSQKEKADDRPNEMPVPACALQGLEILRAWIVDADERGEDLVVASRTTYEGPEYWGKILAVIAVSIAKSSEADGVCTESEAKTQIRRGFDKQWERRAVNLSEVFEN